MLKGSHNLLKGKTPMAQICEISALGFVAIIILGSVAGGIFQLFLCCSRRRGDGNPVTSGSQNSAQNGTQPLLTVLRGPGSGRGVGYSDCAQLTERRWASSLRIIS